MSTAHPTTLIVGLGATGLSCARHLAQQGVRLAVIDSRVKPPGLDALIQELPDVAVFVGGFNAAAFAAAERLVVSPGVSLREPLIDEAIARGVPVLGDIELFARAARAPVAAITGTNGKSTVTALLGAMARAAGREVRVGGNYGPPALDLLGETEPDWYVLELSSFQLDTTTSLNAAAATVLNVTPDHLDRYADLADYARAKQRIFHGDGAMVLNLDDAQVMAMAEPTRRTLRFGLQPPAQETDYGVIEHSGETWLARGAQPLLAVRELRIKGLHNAANSLAALALGEAMGLSPAVMLAALRHFEGLPHRAQYVAEIDGVTWINDSKGTNVGATQAALHGMHGKVVLIAGGLGKGQDFAPLRAAVQQQARAVVLIGQDAAVIAAALGEGVPLVEAKTMEDAVQQARTLAQSGDTVLLSPACASFDMFTGYEDRGQRFIAAVRKLAP